MGGGLLCRLAPEPAWLHGVAPAHTLQKGFRGPEWGRGLLQVTEPIGGRLELGVPAPTPALSCCARLLMKDTELGRWVGQKPAVGVSN